MDILGGWVFLMSEVPLYRQPRSRLAPPHLLAPTALADERKLEELRIFQPLSLHRFESPYRGYSKLRTRTALRQVLCC